MEILDNVIFPLFNQVFFSTADMLRTIHSSEDTGFYEKVVSAIFDEDKLSTKDNHESIGRLKSVKDDTSSIIFTDADTANRDLVVDIAREVYKKHCAKHLDTIPMRILGDSPQVNRYHYLLFSKILNLFFSFKSYVYLGKFLCRSFNVTVFFFFG